MSFLPETRKASKICGFAAVTLNTSLAAARIRFWHSAPLRQPAQLNCLAKNVLSVIESTEALFI
jgi:hypothetical protein